MPHQSEQINVAGNLVATYSSGDDSKFVGQRFANVRSDVLEITHDKLENILIKFYQKHLLRSAWLNPLSLMAGLALTLTTADFKPIAMGIDGSTWKAFFLIFFAGSTLWLVYLLACLVIYWKETSIENLIDRIKNRSEDK